MRTIGLISIVVMGLGMSGCSQISSVFKKKPHYHLGDGTAVYTGSEASLRTTPQQSYQFAQGASSSTYNASQYDRSSEYAATQYTGSQYTGSQYNSSQSSGSQYAGLGVELYNSQPAYSLAAYSDPRDAEFVMLNGESNIADWQNCETLNRGYLFASEYVFSLNPDFEVCMRNKGYVLTTEYGASSKQVLNAQTARLRGPVQYSHSSSTYSGYFR